MLSYTTVMVPVQGAFALFFFWISFSKLAYVESSSEQRPECLQLIFSSYHSHGRLNFHERYQLKNWHKNYDSLPDCHYNFLGELLYSIPSASPWERVHLLFKQYLGDFVLNLYSFWLLSFMSSPGNPAVHGFIFVGHLLERAFRYFSKNVTILL